ncbi:MAG: hypothetical protein JWP16_713 [Alphaproteobacteria bacterium]|nr:hypothetical protein [Alphaproteobacteria bacterium]MDB5739673.1 hypothetical protein [Alphaproteobacteria bacterium]
MRKLVILLTCVLLAGCWQSRSRPYLTVQSLAPFPAGAVTETDPDGRVTHYTLRKVARGRYRMTQTDRGQDFGEGFELGFFPLPGAPSHVLVYGAAALDHPRGDELLRYYGLMVITGPKSAEEIRPDCDKDARAARAAGVRAGKDGACTFGTRAQLEKALLALWKSGKKPQYRYRLGG